MNLLKFIKNTVNKDTILQDSIVLYLLVTTFLDIFTE